MSRANKHYFYIFALVRKSRGTRHRHPIKILQFKTGILLDYQMVVDLANLQGVQD